jgi:hypothetical protein
MALLQTLVLDRVSRCTSFLDVMQTEGWALSDEDYGLGERRGAETKGTIRRFLFKSKPLDLRGHTQR